MKKERVRVVMKISKTSTIGNSTVSEQFIYKMGRESRSERLRTYAPIILLVIETIVMSITSPAFLSFSNIINILYQMSLPLVIATGLTFVLIIGSIDLSVEGIIGFTGAMISVLVVNSKNTNDFGIWGIIIVVLIATGIGFITGLLHVKLRIASFIITFAMGQVVAGLALLSYGQVPAIVKWDVFSILSDQTFIGIPYITWIALAFFAVGCIILHYTAYGKAVYAVGGNENAAKASGIKINKIKILVFTLSALGASVAGVLGIIRLKYGQASLGNDQLFPAITALVLGGTSLTGGQGGMMQTFLGVLIYTELQNYLTMMGVDPYYKTALQGVIIIIAVALTINKSRKIIVK
jgi:ribose transport system permease protein